MDVVLLVVVFVAVGSTTLAMGAGWTVKEYVVLLVAHYDAAEIAIVTVESIGKTTFWTNEIVIVVVSTENHDESTLPVTVVKVTV